jgi:hypothetical protein
MQGKEEAEELSPIEANLLTNQQFAILKKVLELIRLTPERSKHCIDKGCREGWGTQRADGNDRHEQSRCHRLERSINIVARKTNGFGEPGEISLVLERAPHAIRFISQPRIPAAGK